MHPEIREYHFKPEVVMGGRSTRRAKPAETKPLPAEEERRSILRVAPKAHARLKQAAAAQGMQLGDFVDWLVLENDQVRKELQKLLDAWKT